MELVLIILKLIGFIFIVALGLLFLVLLLGSIICFSLPLLEYLGKKISRFSYDIIEELEGEKD